MVHWRHTAADGTRRQVARAVGAAWVTLDDSGEWKPRAGRPRAGELTHAAATVAAAQIVQDVDRELLEQSGPTGRIPTFRELAAEYVDYAIRVRGIKPSTVADYAQQFAEPGTPHLRGPGVAKGRIMAAIGHKRADRVTTTDIEAILEAVIADGGSARTANKVRQNIATVYNWACRGKTYGLPINPATEADTRREHRKLDVDTYTVEQVEQLARALAAGVHRTPRHYHGRPVMLAPDEIAEQQRENRQDGEAVRVAAYVGLRAGELAALRWRAVDWGRRTVTVSASISGDREVASTKSGKARQVPLSDQALVALERLSRREHFTSPDDYVLVSRDGDRISTQALAKRAKRAMQQAGLPPLRWHDLRHTCGSLLVAGGLDLVSVQAAMGHAKLSTTERYLHARSAAEQAERFTQAFQVTHDTPVSPPAAAVES